jgi:phage terminase small subunit
MNKKTKPKPLTAQQNKFAAMLVEGSPQGQAYIATHPRCSVSSARNLGWRLAQDPRVQEITRTARKKVVDAAIERVAMSADDALQKLSAMLRASIVDIIDKEGKLKKDLDDLTKDQRAAIKLIDQNGVVHFYDQKSLLEMLMKHHGLFNKDQTQAVPVNVNITLRKDEEHNTNG